MKTLKFIFAIFIMPCLCISIVSGCKKDNGPANGNNVQTLLKYCDTTNCGHGKCDSVYKRCVCELGYVGKHCDTAIRTKFIGTFAGLDQCSTGQNAYSITISASNDSIMEIVINNVHGQFYTVNAFVGGSSLTVPLQNSLSGGSGFGATISGNGMLNPRGDTLTFSYNFSYQGNYSTCTMIGVKQ